VGLPVAGRYANATKLRNPKKAADFFKQPYSSLVTDVLGLPAITSPLFIKGKSLPRYFNYFVNMRECVLYLLFYEAY
jgi:hypothetical protein